MRRRRRDPHDVNEEFSAVARVRAFIYCKHSHREPLLYSLAICFCAHCTRANEECVCVCAYFIVLSFLLCARILVRAADSNKLIIKRASASHPSFAIYTYVCASDCAHLCTGTSLRMGQIQSSLCAEREACCFQLEPALAMANVFLHCFI
jgi:hypothetical protein